MAKASFEESVNNFFIAAVNNEKDEMGVSSSIMAGKMAEFGTGYFDLLLDINIKNTFTLPDPIKERMKEKLAEKERLALKPFMQPYVPQTVLQTIKPIVKQLVKPIVKPPTNQGYVFDYTLGGTSQLVSTIYEHKNPEPYNVPFTLQTKPKQEEQNQKVSWIKKKKVTVAFTDD